MLYIWRVTLTYRFRDFRRQMAKSPISVGQTQNGPSFLDPAFGDP